MDSFLRSVYRTLSASGHATLETFLSATHHQSCRQVPTGRCARNLGFLDGEQVFVILNEQADRNVRFGDLAVDLGFMTNTDAMGLLQKQKAKRALLGEILVKLGAVEPKRMAEELEIYTRERAGLLGLFLVNRGVTNLDWILEALEHQRLHELPIGRVALLEGIMTADQVLTVLEKQAERNQKFGQVAIDLGFITAEQMLDVLVAQAESRPRLAEILGGSSEQTNQIGRCIAKEIGKHPPNMGR